MTTAKLPGMMMARCKSLLRDYWGKGLGFSQHKSAAYTKYQDLMRRRREQWGVSDGSIIAVQTMLELEMAE